ncbi:MAG: DUF6580 family putative transport protein [Verrucomicrobiota bacterium]|nr:DUF6580 family putative transport protein [Verrucomicrobiota bacterium]
MDRKILVPLILMLVFAASRWHTIDQDGNPEPLLPYNFSAAHALLFCAAFWLRGWLGWVLPMSTIILTDILLNLFVYDEPFLSPESISIWMTLGIFVVLAKWFAKRRSYFRVFLGTLIGALLFYLVSNTVSWMSNPSYVKSFAGWIQALTVGLPGFPPTWVFGLKSLLGTGLFTGLFAGAMKLSESLDAPEREIEFEDEEDDESQSTEPTPEAV